MIPARIGSERLKFKNLALINNKPLIYYSIYNAKKSKIFKKIILNSDDKIFKKISERYKIEFYLRPKKIGSSKTKSDDVVFDFIKKYSNFDIIVWVNPIAPLLEPADIRNVYKFFKKNKLDSLITSEEKKVHSIFENKPLNYKKKEKFKKTQDLKPVKLFSYSLMIWKVKSFIKSYKKKKTAILCGKFSDYPIKSDKSIIIKNLSDLKLAELIMKNKSKSKNQAKYDNILKMYGSKN